MRVYIATAAATATSTSTDRYCVKHKTKSEGPPRLVWQAVCHLEQPKLLTYHLVIMIGKNNKLSTTVNKQRQQYQQYSQTPFGNSPHRPAWAFQTTPNIPGAPTYLRKPARGSFPGCPPFNSASLATAPTVRCTVPPY